jgi:Fic family protein
VARPAKRSAKMSAKQTISMMEPLMPQEGEALNSLSEVVSELLAKSGQLHSKLNPLVSESIGNLVRKMNCYYSNFIEGHNTRPYDIERALKQDFSKDADKRFLQLEAVAHIELQEKIDESATLDNICSSEYIAWLHKSFCEKLPEEMLWVENEETGEKRRVIPGQFRDGNVIAALPCP